ncbi:DNA primase [Candidatus Peregrinibacteria bacterium]|nr:DNA primase [Candidatus Peregrinibacteria bacterium]
MADLVEDIKSRLSIEDVVGHYVQLKKAGRNLKGLCPFHSEKTPSFVVSPEKQICHCFGCNKGGDIFTVVEELEGVNFAEALQILADRAGVKADLSKFKKESKSEKDIYFKAHDLACDFFEEQLYKSVDGKKVLEYLYKRGLKDETIKEFRIGYAPDQYDALYPDLLKKGIPKDVLLKSGLISAKNVVSDEVYDKYRQRLIFPIFDYLGKVCGFGGRALSKDQMPKYLNSPENIIYNKSKVLFGMSHAKQSIKEKDKVVVVEGYFDVVLPYQEGIKHVVASSGTALSEDQVKMIKRLTQNVVTCFDSDTAGFEATKRSYFLFQAQGVNVKTVKGLNQKDPADFVRDGLQDFNDLIENAPDFVSYFMDKLLIEHDKATLDGRRHILNELLPCYKLMSAAFKDFFVRELASKLGMQEKYLYDEMENYKLPADHPARISGEDLGKIAELRRFDVEELIIGLLFEHHQLFEKIENLLDFEDFSEAFKAVYKALTDQYNSQREKFKGWNFEKGVFSDLSGKFDVLTLYVEERYAEFSQELLEQELVKLIDRLKKDRRVGKLREVQTRIVEAENNKEKEKLMELLAEQQKLLNN